MTAYYNEIDAYAAQWLRNLIASDKIAPGDVDERSIIDVRADDLRGYRQCHFFAGVGVWSYALRQAGWPDEKEVWTGSCPCQPFSDAGDGEAFDDERDLWPRWFPLIRERRPVAIVGEQVASRLGLAWLDALHADLEGEAYTVGAVDTCSAGFGSPNIRQRLYWVAYAASSGRQLLAAGSGVNAAVDGTSESEPDAGGRCDAVRLGEPGGAGLEGHGRHGDVRDQPGRIGADATGSIAEASESRGLADPDGGIESDGGIQRSREHGLWPQDGGAGGLDDPTSPRREPQGEGTETEARDEAWMRGPERRRAARDRPGPLNGFWRAADWLCCTDGKWRPVRPGSFPLVTGAHGRLGRLRAYGNAINAQAATHFVKAVMECQP